MGQIETTEWWSRVRDVLHAWHHGSMEPGRILQMLREVLACMPGRLIREVFDLHQRKCESCGLGNIPPLCDLARECVRLGKQAKRGEQSREDGWK